MGLELKRKKDGSLRSANWYGRYVVSGRRFCVNLGVPIEGAIPRHLRTADDLLDPAFIRSRTIAQDRLDQHLREARSGKTAAALARKVYEIEAGNMLGDVKMADLPDRWGSIPRKRTPCRKYMDNGISVVKRFVDFLKERHPKLKKAGQITPAIAMAFMRCESERGISGRTWNVSLTVLKGLFTHLQKTMGLIFNPFSAIMTRTTDSVSREPFSQDDLNVIFEAATSDPELYPVVVTAVCTAMRRGDCCLLKWKHVDLKAGFIAVKTAKTGETVEIPILPLLHAALSGLNQSGVYVFPGIAKTFQQHPYEIDKRLSAILERAGFVDSARVKKLKERAEKAFPAAPADVLLSRGLQSISGSKVDEQPIETAARYGPNRVRQFLVVGDAAEGTDILLGLLMLVREPGLDPGAPRVRRAGQPRRDHGGAPRCRRRSSPRPALLSPGTCRRSCLGYSRRSST